YEQRRPRERESPARTVRRHQDRGAAGALRGHGGRDGSPRRCGPPGPGNPTMDGGAIMADGRTVRRAVGDVLLAVCLLSAGPPDRLSAQDSTRIAEAQAVLAPLVESYGVSGAEGPIREAVKRLLPSWAKSETDTAGNLWVRVGQGSPVVDGQPVGASRPGEPGGGGHRAPGRNRLPGHRDPRRRHARARDPGRIHFFAVRGQAAAGAHGPGRHRGRLPAA